MNDFAALARLIQATEPWRVHLVLVGGWAHRLYRFHPVANAPTYLFEAVTLVRQNELSGSSWSEPFTLRVPL